MREEQIQQAMNVTIQELSSKLADTLLGKNLLAVQVTQLQEKVDELESLLESETTPKKEG